ncbi:inositol polyphosphate multikinase [Whalleya microplaca]|nr:inositol polyphosphate multikinase [Whalleya microplaca]
MLASQDSFGKGAANKDRGLPKKEHLRDYEYAVAGHAGTMCDAEGELFIKPCTKAEVDFYESALYHEDFKKIMPTYIGTLSLNDTLDQAAIHAQIPDLVEHADIPSSIKHEIQSHLHLEDRPAVVEATAGKDIIPHDGDWVPNKTRKISTNQALVLENASFGFKKPNIMDAKLGIRLYADDAPEQKKKRFTEITESTTHKNFGFRVAGMRVYKGSTDESELDEEGFKLYDKDWGRFSVNDDNLIESLKLYIFNEAAGIDDDLGKEIARRFAKDIQNVQEVLESKESRMYSASLLFVFEGDGAALREAIEAEKEEQAIKEAKAKAVEEVKAAAPTIDFSTLHERGSTRAAAANLRVDSGIGMEETEEDTLDWDDLGECGSDECSDECSDEDEWSYPLVYRLKLIDFAHATWTPGQKPDENVLVGVRSLGKLFEEMSE